MTLETHQWTVLPHAPQPDNQEHKLTRSETKWTKFAWHEPDVNMYLDQPDKPDCTKPPNEYLGASAH